MGPGPNDTPAAASVPEAAELPRREKWLFGLYAGHLLTLFGLALSNIFLGLAVVAAPWLAARGAGGWRDRLRRARPLLAALGAYVALLGVSIAFSREPLTSTSALRELFTLAGLPLALVAVRDERRVRWIVDALILFAAGLAILGLSQLLVGYGSIDRRIKGPFSHVMTFSGVLLLIDLLLIARMIAPPPPLAGEAKRPLDRRWLAWSCLALLNVALLTTLTRSAWIGLVAGLLGLVWVRRRRWLLALPAAAVVFVVVAPVPVLARMMSTANLSDESTYDRLCMLDAGLKMIAARPLVGVGPEMAERRYPIYRHPTATRLNVPHLHDSYLQLAAERGLPALAAYLVLVGTALAACWRAYRRELDEGDGRSDLYLGAMAALLAFSVAGFAENNWGDTEVQRMALFLLALPFCLRPVARPDRGGTAEPDA